MVGDRQLLDLRGQDGVNALIARVDFALSYSGGADRNGKYDIREVESAIGALLVGQLFGWQVLENVHSRPTQRKYAGLLGVASLRDVCDREGPYTHRHLLTRFLMSRASDVARERYRFPSAPKFTSVGT